MARSTGAWILLAGLGCSGSGQPADNTSTPTPADMAAMLQPSPAKPAGTVAERIVKAREQAEAKDLPKAIETLEEGLLIDSKDRAALGLLARYLTDQARAVEDAGTTEYYTRLVSAAEYYRILRDTYPDLTDEEKALGLDVLYAEATAHAKSLRLEETTGSLRDLVRAGFKDFDRMRQDPGWAEILATPRFHKEFDEIAATAK